MKYGESLTLGSDEAIEAAEEILEDMPDRYYMRNSLEDAQDRLGYACVAANIANDRYSAGSTAAMATIYILLVEGLDSAKAFAEDLARHEQ